MLQGHANKLVTQNHFDSAFISKQVEEIIGYQEKVLDLTKGREIYLNYMMTSLEFQRDVTEVEHWIAVRMDKFSKAAKDVTVWLTKMRAERQAVILRTRGGDARFASPTAPARKTAPGWKPSKFRPVKNKYVCVELCVC